MKILKILMNFNLKIIMKHADFMKKENIKII